MDDSVHDCTCGVCYHPECSRRDHRALAEVERRQHCNLESRLQFDVAYALRKLPVKIVGWRFVRDS